ncbi:MAG TPA: DUF4097 family beta strand repeat-containing protein [Symbiobacteriaceae bacterium]|nr:DUF4097 family beta strand repeat-containing protein [Symbiobacteriaceae bacterium]
MLERGGTSKKGLGWAMMLLGAVVLAAAILDSRLGAWLWTAPPASWSAPMDGIDRVSVRAGSGQVLVTTDERPDLAVTADGPVNVAFKQNGSELQVRVSTPWWHRPRASEPTFLAISLPKTVTLKAFDLEIRTGMVEIQPMQVGAFHYRGQTGSLSMEGVQANEANLRLVTGKIGLTGFVGSLRTEITSGVLEAQFDALSGPVTVNQVTGKTVLDLPAEAGFTVDAQVRRGLIEDALPLTGTSGSGQKVLRGTKGDGTHAVALRVETGIITLR